MRYLWVLLAMFVTGTAEAIDCRETPDCAQMGYSTADDPNCLDNGYITCPFDKTYKKCVQYNCEALGFTSSDKTTWCASVISCKSNSSMTLCQKPCLATDYSTLKDLAESGDCKVVTMRNDIEIPKNQGITLHADTIIDGGNHALNSSGNQGFDVYTLNNNTGFKNIFIKHNQTQTQQNLHVFSKITSSKSTFQDVQIEVQSGDEENHATPLFWGGTYEISGQFTADIQAKKHYVLAWAHLTFKNADINVTTTGASSDAFNGDTYFINSHGIIKTEGVSIVYEHTLTFENSKIHLNASSLHWSDKKYGTILLKDNAELRLTFNANLAYGSQDKDNLMHIKFETSASAPATLIIEGSGKLDSGDVTASNPSDTLVLNDVTYHPKRAGTTKLSEIESSENWQKQ